MQQLPLGIHDFTKIRKNAFFYVDKTAQLVRLIESGSKYFFARPLGFGKSLLLSTLTAMFQGKTELFHGLAAQEWVRKTSNSPYPVLNFDLSTFNTASLELFQEDLRDAINDISDDYDIELKEIKLLSLIRKMYKKFGYIVVLIDNYEKPIIKCLNDTVLLFKIYDVVKSFYTILGSCDKYLRFIMITGALQYNKTGICSTLDDLNDISKDEKFSDLVGFTQNDVEKYFSEAIDSAAAKLSVNSSEILKSLKKNNSLNLYHPFSLLKCVYDEKINLYSNYIDANIIDSVIPYNCINQGDKFFSDVRKFEIYVDKTELLIYTNKFIDTEHKYICISRPRRFGKTISANMVTAYYDFNADVTKVFNEFKIAKHPTFKTFSNKFIVVKITVQDYLSKTRDVYSLIENIKKDIIDDLLKQFGTNYLCEDINSLMDIVSLNTHLKFVIVIDEWDCILREFRDRENWQKDYLDFLLYWLKDKNYIALVYMTGILPIKKYGTHSALNMFDEYSMVAADPFSEFVGFTETEVQNLCLRYHRDFLECKRWYDGYQSNEFSSIYNPRSVNKYISSGKFGTYWNSTETYESLRMYITLEKFPLHKTITKLLLNDSVPVNTNTFSNDMKTFYSQDDILTLLIHLGYLSYDAQSGSVRIPNKEIAGEFVNAIQNGGWPIVVKAIQNSDKLLEAVFNADCETVAKGIEAAHKETSILQYNDENALAYTISLAFYTARERYILVREFPTGKGFADLVFLARPNRLEPDLLIELKWDKTAAAAIEQIHERNYPESLANRSGRLILVGINYDTTSKKHSCSIEFFEL